jgi:hypothetical protein
MVGSFTFPMLLPLICIGKKIPGPVIAMMMVIPAVASAAFVPLVEFLLVIKDAEGKQTGTRISKELMMLFAGQGFGVAFMVVSIVTGDYAHVGAFIPVLTLV